MLANRRSSFRRTVRVEALEPRRLMSATPAHVALAERLVSEVTATTNSYGWPPAVTWAGIDGATVTSNKSVCSTLQVALLEQAYGFTAAQMTAWTGASQPLAGAMYDAAEAGNGFTAFTQISDVSVGDLWSAKYISGSSDTGHIALIDAAPVLEKTTATQELWDVTVIDSTGSPHTNDTRSANGEDGVGEGTMRMYTDLSGNLTGYSWGLSNASVVYYTSDGVRVSTFAHIPLTSVAAPSNLTAVGATATSIALKWTDNSSNEDGFAIQRSSDGGNTWASLATVDANVTTYTDPSAVYGTAYAYRAYATYGNIVSPMSNPATAVVVSKQPATPTNLLGTLGKNNAITLTWTDNASNETYFYVYRSSNGGKTYSAIAGVKANVTTWTDSSTKSAGKTYVYRVRAYNKYGYSNYSNLVTLAISATKVGVITNSWFSSALS